MKRSALIGWGLGSFTTAALSSSVGLLHLRFMTDSLGLAMGLAGLLVVLSKIYDAILDPLMGALSDRTRTRFGAHRPYLVAGGLLSALSLVLLFNVPQMLSGTALVAFCAGSLLLFSTAYTMFRIPYLAIGRAITQDFNERSRLMTFSVFGSSFGSLAATSAAPYYLANFGSDRAAHGQLAWMLAALVALGGIATFLLIDGSRDNRAGDAPRHSSHAVSAIFRAVAGNRPFRSLIGFKVVMFAGLTLHGAAIPYFTRHVLGASDMSLGGIFMMQTLAMMASQFAWVPLARRIGRRRALMLAAGLEAVAMLSWFAIPAASPSPWVQILGGVEGLFLGGIFFGLYTVLTDTMDHARQSLASSGDEGILAGVFVMVEKATAAFGTFVFSAIMSWVGFVSAKDAGTTQSAAVLSAIVISISVLPALLSVCSCLFLRGGPDPAPLAKAKAPKAVTDPARAGASG